VMGAVNAFYKLVPRLREPASLRAWTIVGDLSAGPRQAAYDWAPYATRVLLVVEPTWQSMLTARRIARIARTPRSVEVSVVVNKAAGRADAARVEEFFGMAPLAIVPVDDGVIAAERGGAAPIDAAPGGPAVSAVEELATALGADSLPA
jgi:CO dehydrogenase nickel-insertion accessory protein CooC1